MLRLGDFIFDATSRRLVREQAEVKISPKGSQVLEALAQSPGRVWRRDALLERIWADVHVGEEVLTHAIAELRRAFGDDFRKPRYIGTVHRGGYKLLTSVTPLGSPLAFASVVSDSTNGAVSLDAYSRFLSAVELEEAAGARNEAEALRRFSDLVREYPHFAAARTALAKSLAFSAMYYGAEQHRLQLALEQCVRAQKDAPSSAEAFAVHGFILALLGALDESRRVFALAVQLQPDSTATHQLLGRASFAEMDFVWSATFFERAAKLRPDDFASLLAAARVRQTVGDQERAERDYRMALPRIEARLAEAPTDFRALCGKARCLSELGDAVRAERLLGDIASHPEPISYYLACALSHAGFHGRALDTIEEMADHGWRHRAWLERDPDFQTLRDHRRFKLIAKSIGHAR